MTLTSQVPPSPATRRDSPPRLKLLNVPKVAFGSGSWCHAAAPLTPRSGAATLPLRSELDDYVRYGKITVLLMDAPFPTATTFILRTATRQCLAHLGGTDPGSSGERPVRKPQLTR